MRRWAAGHAANLGLEGAIPRLEDMHKRGLLTKDGGQAAMNEYFHQIARDGTGFALDDEGATAG